MIGKSSLFAVLAAILFAGAATATEIRVAVASNFAEPAQKIADRFAAQTGHKALLSVGSSGQLYAQIANGAPFDVFLSADEARPVAAERAGLAVAGSRFTYAVGRLVLFSRTPGLVDARGGVLASDRIHKLAIADPKVAPYGVAAIETLRRLGLETRLQPKLVQGASIAQVFQFVDSGAAELGFVAQSQVVTVVGGSRWLVPARDHAPINQQAVLLKAGSADPAAVAFLAFLRGPQARAIIRRSGYEAR